MYVHICVCVYVCTVRARYSAVAFHILTHNGRPIAHSCGRDMGRLLWVNIVTYPEHLNLAFNFGYHTVCDRVVARFRCVYMYMCICMYVYVAGVDNTCTRLFK